MNDIEKAFKWMFFSGDTGMSSKAIMGHFVAGISDGSYPSDPSDLGRCLRLLAQFPHWEARIAEMSKYNRQWSKIAALWSELKISFLSECGGLHPSRGTKADKTYEMMRSLLNGVGA